MGGLGSFDAFARVGRNLRSHRVIFRLRGVELVQFPLQRRYSLFSYFYPSCEFRVLQDNLLNDGGKVRSLFNWFGRTSSLIGRVSEEAARAISAPTIYVKLTPDIRDIDVIKRTRVTLLTITLRESRAKSYRRFFSICICESSGRHMVAGQRGGLEDNET